MKTLNIILTLSLLLSLQGCASNQVHPTQQELTQRMIEWKKNPTTDTTTLEKVDVVLEDHIANSVTVDKHNNLVIQ